MTVYFLDANFILRFLLQDNIEQYNKAKSILLTVDGRKIKAKLTTEIVMEVEYVLRKFYKVPRRVISKRLLDFIETELVELEKKDLLADSLKKYVDVNMDLVDILLFFQAAKEKGEILTFDRDFKKLGVKTEIGKDVS